MENLKILIVEDQLLIAKDLSFKLKDHGAEVVGICPSGEEALKFVESNQPDLILMDIELAGAMDGISTANIIKEQYNIPVIYLSDYAEAKLIDRAKKTMPLNYLTKPFTEEELVRAIEIASYSLKNDDSRKNIRNKHLFLKDNYQFIKIAYDDILFLQAERAYCNVVTAEKPFTFANSMKHVHEQLNRPEFKRVHKSYVVNINKIDSIQGNLITIGKYQIHMSKEHRNDLLDLINIIK